jgi:hypothetical protein
MSAKNMIERVIDGSHPSVVIQEASETFLFTHKDGSDISVGASVKSVTSNLVQQSLANLMARSGLMKKGRKFAEDTLRKALLSVKSKGGSKEKVLRELRKVTKDNNWEIK